MPRKPQIRSRKTSSASPAGRRARVPSPTAATAPRGRSRKLIFQCTTCGGLVDSIYVGEGDDSWCPHCGAVGDIAGAEGHIPWPQLYGSWVAQQRQQADQKPVEKESATPAPGPLQVPSQDLRFPAATQQRKEVDPVREKRFYGDYECEKCYTIYELAGDSSLRCEKCGGHLVKLEFVDEDDEDN